MMIPQCIIWILCCSLRIQEAGYLLTRPPEHIGRYKMVRHKKESRAENGCVHCTCIYHDSFCTVLLCLIYTQSPPMYISWNRWWRLKNIWTYFEESFLLSDMSASWAGGVDGYKMVYTVPKQWPTMSSASLWNRFTPISLWIFCMIRTRKST